MPPPFVKPNVGDVLTRVLSLTDAQKAQLQPYIDTVQPQLDAIHQQAHQSADALLRQLTVSIRPLLSSEQQTKLDVLEKLRTGAAPVNPVGVGSIFANGPAQVAQ
jgi:hypothetical protein